ncbi:MAG: RNA 2',3'-cyclic phosphodiesterase [Chloroflexi bacterium]|nr:MAG: RNA 2',3'-cyclic phosphodiesterase [Chloroflexota bacterium]TMC71354.1 MAG: RNA 2',3'-cyclic phosphodiesterase [Chloroflexota bacterium]
MGSGELEEESARALRVRAFFGLPVPEPQREVLGRFIAACARIAPQFRWTPPENLHLTVRFVGNVDLSIVEAVADALAEQSPPGFELGLGAPGTFGRGRAVRVVWLGLRAGQAEAAYLAAQVEAECARAGLAAEERQFQPHLTLARARSRNGAALPEMPLAPGLEPWRAREVILYSSRLSRTGAVYEALRSLPLA